MLQFLIWSKKDEKPCLLYRKGPLIYIFQFLVFVIIASMEMHHFRKFYYRGKTFYRGL